MKEHHSKKNKKWMKRFRCVWSDHTYVERLTAYRLFPFIYNMYQIRKTNTEKKLKQFVSFGLMMKLRFVSFRFVILFGSTVVNVKQQKKREDDFWSRRFNYSSFAIVLDLSLMKNFSHVNEETRNMVKLLNKKWKKKTIPKTILWLTFIF